MNFFSTRDINKTKYSPSHVIKQGLAPDGGLFYPESHPIINNDDFKKLLDMDYAARAAYIIGLYLTDYSENELLEAAKNAYKFKKFGASPAPTTRLGNNFMLELWNGPTSAFKDMALQILPHLLSISLEKTNEQNDILILVATSGDTGKAALEGFADADRVKIMVFYPEKGVSSIQKLQMQTQLGENVGVVAINENFDDAQSGIKDIFSSKTARESILEKGYLLSSANSINFGRLVPQIVYYISAYCDMVTKKQIIMGDEINITVPTGNFGNILAAYMAKKMGLPVGKLICASNMNNVLTDFFNNGVYDKRRDFHTTISPSMDILISSNLERLIYLICGTENNIRYMEDLKTKGFYELDASFKAIMANDFKAYFCNEEEAKSTINRIYYEYNYLSDPHTAVGIFAADAYQEETGDDRKMIIASTASPYKFAPAMCSALDVSHSSDEFSAIDALYSKTKWPVPYPLAGLKNLKKRFDTTTDRDFMLDSIMKFI